MTLLGYADGVSDKLLRVADKNPNRAGITRVMTDLGLAVVDVTELKKRVKGGQVKALFLVGHEFDAAGELAEAVRSLEVFVHVAATRTALAEVASVTLPGLAWVQIDGTWVSGENRAQRLNPGFPAFRDARANHLWITELASRLGVVFPWPSVQTLRAEIQTQLPSFRSARLTEVGPQGHVIA